MLPVISDSNPGSIRVNRAEIIRAAQLLASGGLVAFPTETVYGLGADADDEEAVRTIFVAKRRPSNHPLILHVRDRSALDQWARDLPWEARVLTDAFWPGPLTLVLRRRPRARDAITGGQDTVAVRALVHPWARALLNSFSRLRKDGAAAIAAPSANRFGHISPSTAEHVREGLGQKPRGPVDLVLDGGPCPIGIESTIVDLSGRRVRLLRPGAITRTQIEVVLKVKLQEAGDDAPRASGRLEQHYAPLTPLELVDSDRLPARIEELGCQRIAILAPESATLAVSPRIVLRIVAPAQPDKYSHCLYTFLHDLDSARAERILVERPPREDVWEAVNDRLLRAAGTGCVNHAQQN